MCIFICNNIFTTMLLLYRLLGYLLIFIVFIGCENNNKQEQEALQKEKLERLHVLWEEAYEYEHRPDKPRIAPLRGTLKSHQILEDPINRRTFYILGMLSRHFVYLWDEELKDFFVVARLPFYKARRPLGISFEETIKRGFPNRKTNFPKSAILFQGLNGMEISRYLNQKYSYKALDLEKIDTLISTIIKVSLTTYLFDTNRQLNTSYESSEVVEKWNRKEFARYLQTCDDLESLTCQKLQEYALSTLYNPLVYKIADHHYLAVRFVKKEYLLDFQYITDSLYIRNDIYRYLLEKRNQ